MTAPAEVVLANDHLVVRLLPLLGARVQSVRHLATNHELLYQRDPAAGSADGDYLSRCTGGWDDLFPNDSPWVDYPDHGCVWSSSFRVHHATTSGTVLSSRLSVPPVDIVRRVQLPGDRAALRIETRLRARADVGPALWGTHPMLAVGPGARMTVDRSPAEIEADAVLHGRFRPGRMSAAEWNRAQVLPDRNEPLLEVVYVDGVDSLTVTSPASPVATRLAWDERFFPYVWLCPIVASLGISTALVVEPSTSRPFDLGGAVAAGRALDLKRGERRSWWTELEAIPLSGPGEDEEA